MGGRGTFYTSRRKSAGLCLSRMAERVFELEVSMKIMFRRWRREREKKDVGGGEKTQAVEKGEFSSPFWRDVSEAKGRVIQFAKRGCSFLVMLCKCALQKRSFRAWKPASK